MTRYHGGTRRLLFPKIANFQSSVGGNAGCKGLVIRNAKKEKNCFWDWAFCFVLILVFSLFVISSAHLSPSRLNFSFGSLSLPFPFQFFFFLQVFVRVLVFLHTGLGLGFPLLFIFILWSLSFRTITWVKKMFQQLDVICQTSS